MMFQLVEVVAYDCALGMAALGNEALLHFH